MPPISVIMIIAMVVICGGAYLMKDKIISMFSNPEYERKQNAINARLESEYDKIFQEYLHDKEAFAYILNIVKDENIIGLIPCKEQRSVTSAMVGAAKTIASGMVKVRVDTEFYLVIGKEHIYNIQINTKSKQGEILKTFSKSEIEKVVIGKGNMFDDLKQAQKFKLKGGGMSGDGEDNSNLKKVQIYTGEGKEEFFCYEYIKEGKIENKALSNRGIDMKKLYTMPEQELLETTLSYTIPKKTFEKLAYEYNGTIK